MEWILKVNDGVELETINLESRDAAYELLAKTMAVTKRDILYAMDEIIKEEFELLKEELVKEINKSNNIKQIYLDLHFKDFMKKQNEFIETARELYNNYSFCIISPNDEKEVSELTFSNDDEYEIIKLFENYL